MDLRYPGLPNGLLRTPGSMTPDEVQCEPDLLVAVRREIDRDRANGRFLIAGSADLLLMKRVSESLAGRASYLTLRPMTRREQLGLGSCGGWEVVAQDPVELWLEKLSSEPGHEEGIPLARRGGYPSPAVEMRRDADRRIWFQGYVETYLERDLRELSAVASLPDFRRLMQAASLRLGQQLNETEMARDTGIPQPTVHRYPNLLQTSCLLMRLPAYSVNRTKRLIKGPKLYWGDTGIALYLSDRSDPDGHHLENLVLNDLLVWCDTTADRAQILYWRTTSGEEVDFVIETPDRLIPIEVKSTAHPTVGDARHITAFRCEYGNRSTPGLLLHTGTTLEWLSQDVIAVPWWRMV